MTGNHVNADMLRKPAASRMCPECMVADSIHHMLSLNFNLLHTLDHLYGGV